MIASERVKELFPSHILINTFTTNLKENTEDMPNNFTDGEFIADMFC